MEQELKDRLDSLEQKLERTEKKVRQTHQILVWSAVGTLIVVVLPIIGLIWAIPWMISTMTSTLGGIDVGALQGVIQ
ncbi:hypothetical protein GF380_04015 [Candidatus Uhrbacteria bacterium]|nr:hypothetical protein [Candidatus Uhrbacteria bacterium]MBD3284256.1 hypothetical protein [Candidatus Uhrbacteria bacterium]